MRGKRARKAGLFFHSIVAIAVAFIFFSTFPIARVWAQDGKDAKDIKDIKDIKKTPGAPGGEERLGSVEEDALAPFPLFDSQAFASGDFDLFLEECGEFIGKHPDSPQAELLFTRVRRYSHRATNYQKVFEPMLERVLEDGVTNGHNEEMYRLALAGFYEKRGLRETALKMRSYEDYMLDCLMLGPFGNSRRAALEQSYLPERDLIERDVDSGKEKTVKIEYIGTDKFRKLVWRKYPYELPIRSPRVNMFKYLRPSGGCAYALIQVHVAAEQPVLIDVSAGDYFKLWVNRILTLDINAGRKRQPDSHLVAVNLSEGWNHILLKTRAIFSLALRDFNGRLIKDLELETGLKIHPAKRGRAYAAGAGSSTAPRSTDQKRAGEQPPSAAEYNGGALRYYSKLTRTKKDDPMALAAYSYMLASHGLDVDAFEAAEAAYELGGKKQDNPFLTYYMATCYLRARHYPHELATNKARELVASIIEKKKDFVLAHERKADYLVEDDKHEEALKKFHKIEEMGLDNFYTHRLLYDIYSSMRWEPEKIRAVKEIEAALGRRTVEQESGAAREWLLRFWERYYSRRNNIAKAWEYTEKLYQLNKSGDWFLSRQAARALELGRLDAALKIYQEILKLDSHAHWAIYRIADIYRKQGRYANAIEQRKMLLRLRPESASEYKEIGDIYREWGKVHSAIHWYEKSLGLEPGNWTLRRYVQYLKGEDEDFWKPYALSPRAVEKLIREAPGKEAYPKAKNLIVLDETVIQVLPDGSQSRYIHRVYKILDISGKDIHSRPSVGGELLELRTILPDGTILEPASVYGSYTMPALGENVVLEYCYRTDSGGVRSPGEYESSRFFLQDPGLDEPLSCRRVVVIMSKKPRDKKTVDLLKPLRRTPWSVWEFVELKENLLKESGKEGVKSTVKETQAHVIYTWTSEKMPRIEEEPYMPPVKEILPSVQFVGQREWSDFTEQLKERTYLSGVIPTQLIQRRAGEIVSGASGQYEQVKALYDWCMKEIKGGYGGGEAHAILLKKEGDRKTLFAAFLNALGIPFDIVLIGPNPLTKMDTQWDKPNAYYFSSSALRVKPRRHEPLYVTLDTRYAPLGKIPERYQGAPAFVPGEGMEKMFQMPLEALDTRAQVETFLVDLDSLVACATLLYPATYSFRNKEWYKDMPIAQCRQRVERYANNYFPGSLLTHHNLPDLEKVGRMFEINFTCKAPNFLTPKPRDGTILTKTGIDPLDMQSSYAGKATREFPMVLWGINFARTDVTINLGDTYEVVQLPANVIERNDFGTYFLSFSRTGSLITVKRRYSLLPQRIELERHEDFMEFCKKIDVAELGRIILRVKEEPESESGVK